MDLSYATIPIGENASYKLVNEKPMTEHVETPEYLFEEAMRPTEEVGNYMVMANYWEEPQHILFPPAKYGRCILMGLSQDMVLEQESSLLPLLEKKNVSLSI